MTSTSPYKNKANNLLKFLSILALLIPHIAHADFPWDLIKKTEFKKSYLKTIADKRKENWIAELNGPSSEVARKTIAGDDYIVGHSCMPHNCGTYNLIFFYSANKRQVFIKLNEDGEYSILGKPTPKIEEELNAYYAHYFSEKTPVTEQLNRRDKMSSPPLKH
jgi:hypothetical protein